MCHTSAFQNLDLNKAAIQEQQDAKLVQMSMLHVMVMVMATKTNLD